MQKTNTIYRRLFESANAGIIIIDADFKIIDCNETALNLLDRPRQEVIGCTPVDAKITPEYQQNNVRSDEIGPTYFSRSMQGEDLRFEWQHLKKDGTEFPVEVSLFGFAASGGQNFFAMWRDLTEVKQKEHELKQSEERFRNIFSQAKDGVLILEEKSGILDCNSAAVMLLNYKSKDELIGKDPWVISPAYQPDGKTSEDKAKSLLKACIRKGDAQSEWVHLKSNGEFVWFDIVLTRIVIDDQKYIHCVWRDITEDKKHQDELEKYRNHLEELVNKRTTELEKAINELKETQSQLIQSEKMASLGVLTTGVAHEINNPLNFIHGSYIGLEKNLSKECKEDLKIAKLLETLKTGVERTADIVKGLNQFSSNQESMTEFCDIHSIINNSLLMLRNLLRNRIELVKDYWNEPLSCSGNVAKLHQVFVNILTNAIQSIESEGRITITTKEDGGNCIIEISDTGCGIRNEDLTKIMDPFFTTKDPGLGTGLGLSVSYTIINEHNGSMDFNSVVDQGTTAIITLPIK